MKEILKESLSRYVYHFTTMNALDSIIEFNRIELSDARISNTDMACMPEGYNFYLSFTTQSSPEVGYVKAQNRKNQIVPKNKKRDEYDTYDERDGDEPYDERDEYDTYDERDGYEPYYERDIYESQCNISHNIDEDSNGKYSSLHPKRIKDLERFDIDANIRRRKYAPDYAKRIDSMGVKSSLKYKDDKGNTIYVMDKNAKKNRDSISRYSETEQRLFSKERVMNNVYDYIERIDIFPFINNMNVRICFNGDKISSKYKCGPVDYIFQKYKDALKRGGVADKRADTTSKAIGDIPKRKGKPKKNVQISEASKSSDGFNKNQIDQLFDWSKTKQKNWASKIFIHSNNKNSSFKYGLNIIKKHAEKLGILDLNKYKILDDRFKGLKSSIKRGIIEVTPSVINDICTIIFTLTPSFNGNKNKKITYCNNIINDLFKKIKVFSKKDQSTFLLTKLLKENIKLGSDFSNDWFNSKSKNLNKFNSTSAIIQRLSKTYKGPLHAILVIIEEFIESVANSAGVNKNAIVYHQWINNYDKKSKEKVSESLFFTKTDIMEMVNKVLINLNK